MATNRKMLPDSLLGILLFVFASGFSSAQSQASDVKALPVSLIRVIANPERLEGRTLRVIGFLDYGGGLDRSVCLYLSEADARNAVFSNCIYVKKAFDRGDKHLSKYVVFNAKFRYVAGGNGPEFLSFEDISDMKLWPSQADK